tara:strand:- start:242 stop:991 length:750 start_codon:yes stop_codon:yes gene_type:complete
LFWGRNILGKSTSEESEKLSLAIYALSEVATKKLKSSIILLEDELDMFCHSILSRDEEKQVQIINNLCNKIKSTDLLIEELIPKTADKLGNMWKQDQVSFIDVSFAVDRLQKLLRIYEKKYLGPLYLDYKGPAILLILPKTETHSLGILTASMIMKKNGANPFLALGYSESKLIDLINSIDFKLFGISMSCNTSIEDSIKLAKFLKKTKPLTPIVLGTSFEFSKDNKSKMKKIFSKITSDPIEAIKDLL